MVTQSSSGTRISIFYVITTITFFQYIRGLGAQLELFSTTLKPGRSKAPPPFLGTVNVTLSELACSFQLSVYIILYGFQLYGILYGFQLYIIVFNCMV